MAESSKRVNKYIRTATGSFVSRHANLKNAEKGIELKGRSWIEDGVTLCGDLAFIRVGRYNLIGVNTTITPPVLVPSSSESSQQQHSPVSIGAHTSIGSDCDIQAAAIGSYNLIEKNVTLGPRVILKDAVVVAEGTKIPADTVVPPFTRVSQGTPIQMMPLSPSTIPILQDAALDTYHERVRVETEA